MNYTGERWYRPQKIKKGGDNRYETSIKDDMSFVECRPENTCNEEKVPYDVVRFNACLFCLRLRGMLNMVNTALRGLFGGE